MNMPVTTTDLDCPPEVVFDYVTDPRRFSEWQQGVVSARMESEEPHCAGARCVTRRKVGFVTRDFTSEVTHVDRPRSWGVRGIDGPIRAVVDVLVEPLDDGARTRLTIGVDFEGRGFGALLVPLVVRPQAAREMPANLDRLKARIPGAG
ncbi:MAG: SRPBCC family protein [Acidobacteriota bacterium]|nr:SRPBCC family protein [Acidobacteriota bacterium]